MVSDKSHIQVLRERAFWRAARWRLAAPSFAGFGSFLVRSLRLPRACSRDSLADARSSTNIFVFMLALSVATIELMLPRRV
jgi:hypothetical protein